MNNKNQRKLRKGKVGDRFRTVKLNNNNIKAKNKKEYTKIIILAVFLLTLVCGTSYALFKVLIDDTSEQEIVAGTFKVEFEEGNEIKLPNLAPMSDSEGMTIESYKFTVKNTGTINAKYNLSLEEKGTSGNTLDKSYIKYSIKIGNGSWTTPKLLSEGLLLNSGTLSADTGSNEVGYELKMWLREDADNSAQGKSFAARVVISAVQTNTIDKIGSTTPVIRLNGESNISIEQGTIYSDAGVGSVTDDKDQIPTTSVEKTYTYLNNDLEEEVSAIDTTRLGTYYIYYRVTDSDNNTGVTVRSVNVIKKNTVAPIIKLKGEDTISVPQGTEYKDLGATATDSSDKDISKKIVTIGEVNTKVLGTYVIKYVVTDSNGNTSSISRTVIVEKRGTINITNTEPVIDDNTVTVDINAIAVDGYIDGYLFTQSDKKPSTKEFKSIEKTNDYQTTETILKNGTYYVWVKDTNGNVASKSLVITIVDDEGPICNFSGDNYFGINTTKTIDLICTDHSKFQTKYLTADNFTINNKDAATITSVDGIQNVTGGIKYTLHIKATATGNFTISFDRGQILDVFGNPNISTVSNKLEVTDLSIDKNDVTLDVTNNKTHQITVTGNKGTVDYASNNSEIATVSDDGLVTGIAPGDAAITVKDTTTGALETLKVHVKKTISVNFIKQGRGVNSIVDVNNKEVTTASCELTTDNPDSCTISPLPIIDVKEGYEAVGWNTSSTAYDGSLTEISITESIGELYSISKRKAIELKATWNANKATLSNNMDGKSSTCELPEVFNDEAITTTSCQVTAPTINGSVNTPEVLGFSNGKDDHENIAISSGGTLTLTEANTDGTWYAQTENNPNPLTVNYISQGIGVESIVNMSDDKYYSCTPEKVYNGAEPKTTCEVSLLDVKVKDGFSWLGWNESSTAHDGTKATLELSKAETNLHTITLRNSKNLTVTFRKNGLGVTAIGSTSTSCEIGEEYNATTIPTECKATMPTVTVNDDYEALGWSQNENAKETDSVNDPYGKEKYIPFSKNITLSNENNGANYYSISKTGGTILNSIWHYNGVDSLKDSEGNTIVDNSLLKCDLPEKFNNEPAVTSCNVTAPTIEREGFNKTGFHTNKDLKTTNDLNIILEKSSVTLTKENTGTNYYAITNKPISVSWNKNGADSIGATNSACTIYNDSRSCDSTITSPSITRGGTTIIGWNKDSNATTSSWNVETTKTLTLSDLDKITDTEIPYYAITKKEAKKYTVKFDVNGNQNVTSSIDCTIPATYNTENQDNSCKIISPTINPSDNTPNVIGWSKENKDRHENDWTPNTEKAISADTTYYAQTKNSDITRTVTYHKQGLGVTAISKPSDSCTIPTTYNGVSQSNSCNIETLADITVSNGYSAKGWSQNENANTKADSTNDPNGATGYIPINITITLTSNADYYSISKKDDITYTATFNKNGAESQTKNGTTTPSTATTVSEDCTIPGQWNNIASDTTCPVTTPTITASTNTPDVKGYATEPNATVGSKNVNTSIDIGANMKYYAITEHKATPVTGTFNINGAKSFTHNGTTYTDTNSFTLCTKSPTYNGVAQTNCTATMPKINASTITPTVKGWSDASTNHTIKYNSEQTNISLGSNVSLFAQTEKDAITYTVKSYNAGTNVESVGAKTDSNSKCTIGAIYNGNNGVAQATACTVTPPTINAKKGYTAGGWSTSGGSENQNPIILTSTNTGKDWYASASANTYSIAYYSNGTKIAEKSNIKVGSDPTLDTSSSTVLKNVLVKSGYTFKGWDSSSNATNVTYADGSTITGLTPDEGDVIKIYAVWIDEQGPTCTWGAPASNVVTNGSTTLSVTCTDVNGVNPSTLSTSNFTTTNTNGSVTNVTSSAVTNGYKYTVTVKGLSVGTFGVNIPAGTVSDSLGNTNSIKTSSNVTVNGITYTATFTKFASTGTGVTAIGATSLSCTTTGSNLTCNVTAPSITVSSGYTADGWSTSTDSNTTTGTASGNNIELSSNGNTYRAISHKNAITYTATFNANGSTVSSSKETCTIPAAYNTNTQATSCNNTITVPTITRDGFTILGFNETNSNVKQAPTGTIISGDKLTLSSNKNYYALSYKDVTVTFNSNGASINGGDGGTKTIYNSATSVSFTSPTITRNNFEIVGFAEDPNAIIYYSNDSNIWKANTSKSFSANANYSAITFAIPSVKVKYYDYSNSSIKEQSLACGIWNTDTECVDPGDYSNIYGGTDSHLIGFGGISSSTNSTTNASNYDSNNHKITLSATDTGKTYYAYYTGTKSITYNYYSGGVTKTSQTISRSSVINTAGTAYVVDNSNITVPSAVTSSKDVAGNSYVGVANNVNTMSTTTPTKEGSNIYYAVYRSSATIHYSVIGGEYDTITSNSGMVYKNGFYSSASSFKNVISKSDLATSNYSLTSEYQTIGNQTDYTAKVPAGFTDSDIVASNIIGNLLSVDKAATSTATTFYLSYKRTFPIEFKYYGSAGSMTSAWTEGSIYYSYDLSEHGTNYLSTPNEVTTSTGPYGTKYNGVTGSIESMGIIVQPSTNVSTYYATYQTPVTRYYYNAGTSSGTSTTIYRNSFYIGSNSYGTVLSTSSTGTSNMSSTSGLGNHDSSAIGFSASGGDVTNPNIMSSSTAAKTTYTSLYTVYSASVDISFYYYNSTSSSIALEDITKATRYYTYSGSIQAMDNANIGAPVESSGPYGTKFIGWSNKDQMGLYSFTQGGNLYISANDTIDNYYAIYQTPVTQYYYNGVAASKTIYRNSFVSGNNYSTVLSTSSVGTSNFDISSLTGYSSSTGVGLATSASSASYSTVAAMATSTNTTLYTVYKKNVTVTFYHASGTGAGWNQPTSTGTRLYNYCLTVLSNGTVSVPSSFSASTVPSISGLSGFAFNGWATTSGTMGDLKSGFTTANTAYYATYTASRNIEFQKGTGISSLTSTSLGRPAYVVKPSYASNYAVTSSYSLASTEVPGYTTFSGYTFAGWYNGSTKVSFPYTISTGATLTANARDTEVPTVGLYGQNAGTSYTNGTKHTFNLSIYVIDNNNKLNSGKPQFNAIANITPSVYIGSIGSKTDASATKISGPVLKQLDTNYYASYIEYAITIESSNTVTGSLGLYIPSGYAVDTSGNSSGTTTFSGITTINPKPTTY